MERCNRECYVSVPWALPLEQVTGNFQQQSEEGGCGGISGPTPRRAEGDEMPRRDVGPRGGIA